MKNHRIIKIGLIIPDINQIKDYQISVINSLKKNKNFKFKLIKTNSERPKKVNKLLFFFEKKFQRRKNKFFSNCNNDICAAEFKTLNNIITYKKNDIDIFVNLLGYKISNNFKKIIKPFWEINYGRYEDLNYPICFDDLIKNKPFSQIKIVEIFKGKFREVIVGKFNLRKYALLHEEFMYEKTHVLLSKALNLFDKKKITYKDNLNNDNKSQKISLIDIFKYYINNYLLSNISKKKYWKIFFLENQNNLKFKLNSKNLIKSHYNEYFADPFIFKFKKQIYIFFESFEKKKNRGNISFININHKHKINKLLKNNYHFSYPFVFEFKNKIYLSPETAKIKELQIWQCLNFPNKWKIYKKAFQNESIADPTFFKDKNDKLWLFLNKSLDKYNDHNSELYIYEVRNNFTKFVPHKLNPVIIDCTIARNGGNLFYNKSKLFKPCQINIHGEYGYGLRLLEIKTLSLNKFIYKKKEMYKNIHHLTYSKDFIAWDKSI